MLTMIMFIALSKNIQRKSFTITTKVNQNKKKFIINEKSMNEKNSIRRKFFLNNSLIRTQILKFTNLKKIKEAFKNVKKFQIKYYNKRYNSQFYKVKDRVLLNFKNITFNRFSKKFNFKFYERMKLRILLKKMTYRLILFKAFQSRNTYDVMKK